MANLSTYIQVGANTGNFVGSITGTTISGSGNVTGGNIRTAGSISATGNITGGNLTVAEVSGNVSSSTVSASGNITGGNVLTSGQVSATGNVYGNNFVSNGTVVASGSVITDYLQAQVTGNITSNGYAITSSVLSSYGNVSANTTTGVITLAANKTYELTGGLALANNPVNGELTYNWYNITGNAVLGTAGGLLINSFGATAAWQPTAKAVISTTVPTQVALRANYVSGANATVNDTQSYVMVEQIQQTFTLNNLNSMSVTGNIAGNNISATGNITLTTSTPAIFANQRKVDWTAMIHGNPATGGSITGSILGNASYLDSANGVQLTANVTLQSGSVAWNATNFDFTKDFVLEWSWYTSNSGTNPADGVWASFGGSSDGSGTAPSGVPNGAIGVRYLTFTNLYTQWYSNAVAVGNSVGFRAGVTYQGEWMTSKIMVRTVGASRYAYLYTGVSGVCDNALDITSWAPAGNWIVVGASTGGLTSQQLCCHVALEYI